MKRIFTLLAMIGIFFGAWADRPVATLSHEGKLTFFTSGTCFAEAVNAAVDGDIVYLSEGNFIRDGLPDSNVINKNISIIGNGRKTNIVGNISINLPADAAVTNALFDSVTLGEISISLETPKVEFRKCGVSRIVSYNMEKAKEFRLDRCSVGSLEGKYVSYEILNSKIGTLWASANSINDAWLYNSHVSKIYAVQANYVSCIIGGNTYPADNVFGENCIVGPLKGSDHKLTNCWMRTTSVLDENLECTIDLSTGSYLGKDGTQIGLYGGEWLPYSETPSLPSVDMAKSTFDIDKASNKLKVKVAVTQP
jgi:hypothetical protein